MIPLHSNRSPSAMRRLNWILLFASCVLCGALSRAAIAQDVIRCDVDGKTVYSEKACAKGAPGTVVAPTHDSAEQKKAGEAAGKQIRADNAAVDKRLDARLKRDTVRPGRATAEESDKKRTTKRKTVTKHHLVTESTSSKKARGTGGKTATTRSKSKSAQKPKSDVVTRPPVSRG